MYRLILILCFFISIASQAQEYVLSDVLCIDMLEFKTEYQAERIQDKLFEVGLEIEIQEGETEGEKRFYIELQDVSILDIEFQNDIGEWERVFPKNIKKKLIKVNFEI